MDFLFDILVTLVTGLLSPASHIDHILTPSPCFCLQFVNTLTLFRIYASIFFTNIFPFCSEVAKDFNANMKSFDSCALSIYWLHLLPPAHLPAHLPHLLPVHLPHLLHPPHLPARRVQTIVLHGKGDLSQLGLFLFPANRLSLCMEEFHKSPVFIATGIYVIYITCFKGTDVYCSLN